MFSTLVFCPSAFLSTLQPPYAAGTLDPTYFHPFQTFPRVTPSTWKVMFSSANPPSSCCCSGCSFLGSPHRPWQAIFSQPPRWAKVSHGTRATTAFAVEIYALERAISFISIWIYVFEYICTCVCIHEHTRACVYLKSYPRKIIIDVFEYLAIYFFSLECSHESKKVGNNLNIQQ